MYGTLNLLTPAVVRAAYEELRDGVSVSLNWPLDAIRKPAFGRQSFAHRVIDFRDTADAAHGYDDVIEFNTQCSSQWDSLCHYHHQTAAAGYNGAQTNKGELERASCEDKGNSARLPTLDHWHARGGLVARGVLIDFRRWAEAEGRRFNAFEGDRITVEDIEAVARSQGVEFRTGDVVIIRSGFTEGLQGKTGEEQEKLIGPGRYGGVTGTVDTAKWFWNHHFAAVAGDMIAFEHLPPEVDGRDGTVTDLVLHPYFLSMFGMPIGELWDLKALSETCRELNRYTFLLTSAPLNVPGSIASPPNALALF